MERDRQASGTFDLGPSFTDSLAVAFDLAPVPLLLVDEGGIVRGANGLAVAESGGGDPIGRPLAGAGFDPDLIPAPPGGFSGSGGPAGRPTPASHLRLLRLPDPPAGSGATGPSAGSVTTDSVGNLVRQIADGLPDISTIVYDGKLRIVAAGGRPLHRAGFDARAMVGQHLAEILGESVDDLVPLLRRALAGEESTIDFLSPVNGLEYRITCHPITGSGGRPIAALMTNQEVTEDLRRSSLLDEVRRLSQVGSATYDRIRGWTVDAELSTLFGASAHELVPTGWETLVLAEDRAAVRDAYHPVLRSGGRASARYRLRHPRTGAIRDAQGAITAAVDHTGRLVRAVLTHVDITAAVAGERMRAKAAQDRTQLLRRVSDILAHGTDDQVASIQKIADLARATLGGESLVRVVTLRDGVPDLNLLSAAAPDGPARPDETVRGSVRAWIPPPARLDPEEPSTRLYSSIGNPSWRLEYKRQTGHPAHPSVAHFISAPVRHDGEVHGFVRAFRLDPHQPFEAGDDDLLQVLADRVGAALGESRVRDLLARPAGGGQTIAERVRRLTADQRELLAQLSRVEERERLMLAEAIHDGPMQLVVAATMRLDAMTVRLDGPAGPDGDRPAAPTGSGSIDGPAAGEEAGRLVDLLAEAVTELRTLVSALTPPEISGALEHGLGPALRQLADGVLVLDDRVEVAVTGIDRVGLSRSRQVTVLRILREALTNVRKHARAAHVWIELAEAGGVVTVTLRDDGVGTASLDAGPGHLGMATMRGRAAAEGGALDVRSSPGAGTVVILRLPTDPAGRPDGGGDRPDGGGDDRPGTARPDAGTAR